MTRSAAAVSVSIILLTGASAHAQSTTSPTPPKSQSSQLRDFLGLGDANGCVQLLGITTTDQDEIAAAIVAAKFGKELRAICGPSAVTSASSLGGGINTPQATKSTSSFRPRPRPTSTRPSAAGPIRDVGRFVREDPSSTSFQVNDPPAGVGFFGGIQLDDRTRAGTVYESGYTSTLTGFVGGVDYRRGSTIGGGWIGKGVTRADFTNFGALLTGVSDATTTALLSSPANLATICGGISTGGDFEDRTTQLGAFVGSAVGKSGFVEATFGWSRLAHDYNRSVCTIEGNPGMRLVTVNGKPQLQDSNGNPQDDIFAGTISGVRNVREVTFGFGAGGEFGNGPVTFTPHADLTFRRANSDAYVETGRSTVMGIDLGNGTSLVDPNAGDNVILTLGGPTGLEMAFDPASRTSIVLESGGALAVRAGRVIPYVGGYWRREFKDEYPLVTAHMAQDPRTTPMSFTFGSDAFDRNTFLFKFGATIVGNRGAVRLEWAKNSSDVLFKTRTLSAHAVVVF